MADSSKSSPYYNSYKALLACAIISYVVAGISAILIVCLFSKINLAIAIIRVYLNN